MFIAELFVTTKKGKQSKCSSTGKWTAKCGESIEWNTYLLFTNKKKRISDTCHKMMSQKKIMLSKKKPKDYSWYDSIYSNAQKRQICGDRM